MEWKTINDTFTFIRNGKSIKQFGEEGFPITRIETIADRFVDETRVGYASIHSIKEHEDYVLQKGDILMSHINSVKHLAKTAIFNSDSILIHGMNLLCLRADKNVIDPYYGCYYLNSDMFMNQIPGITKNSVNQASFNITNLKGLEIPIPSIEIQKQLVAVLDEAQRLIDHRKEQIKLLDDLIESLFYDMFGDPVKNDKGWEVEKLGDSTEIITGNTPPRKEASYYGDHIEWIKSDNINTPHMYLTKAEEYLSEKGKGIGRYIDAGSILMTCIAGSIGCIGNVAITDREVAFNQQINAIVPINYHLHFLYILFKMAKEYIQNNSTSSMKGMISKGNLSNLGFIVPPLPLQNEFAEKVELIEQQKALMEQSLKLMEDNYNGLMQRAFKGELF